MFLYVFSDRLTHLCLFVCLFRSTGRYSSRRDQSPGRLAGGKLYYKPSKESHPPVAVPDAATLEQQYIKAKKCLNHGVQQVMGFVFVLMRIVILSFVQPAGSARSENSRGESAIQRRRI